MHILFNILALYWVGRAIEPVLGLGASYTLCLVSALGELRLHYRVVPHPALRIFVSTVGASGAVFGCSAPRIHPPAPRRAKTTAIVTRHQPRLRLRSWPPGREASAEAVAGVGATWVSCAWPARARVTWSSAEPGVKLVVALGMIAR